MSEIDAILNEPDDDTTDAAAPEVAVVASETAPEGEAAGTRGEPAPDSAPETGSAPASTPITREDGATWSEASKRWHLNGKIVAGEPPGPVEQAPEAVTPVAVAPEAPKVETPSPIAEPFTFRGAGQKFSIPGMTVPPEYNQQVRDLLAAGLQHQQQFPKMQAEHKQKLAQVEALVEAKSGKYNKASVYLFDKISSLLAENPVELEMTRRELALMLKEADLTIPKAPEPEQDAGGVDETAARSTLSGYVKELFEDVPDAGKYFTPEDRKDFEAHVQELIESFYVEHEGEYKLAEHKVEALFRRQLGLLQRAHQARDTATRDAEKAKAAAAFNAAQKPVLAATPVKAPAPKPAHAAAPSGQKPGWDQSYKRAWEEQDEE